MLIIKSFFILTLFKCNLAFFSDHKEPEVEMSNDLKSSVLSNVKEMWIQQKLDHFDENESRVWKMRYFQNDGYLSEGGPIFIYIGGEWTISTGWLVSGHVHDMTREFNGIMFYTEHRYYGKSHTTSDTSYENLKYLTVQQALADLAHFIKFIKSSNSKLHNSGVIVIGASYSASMATWMRLKYPDLVDGAWASSAPLTAKMNFFEYNEVMTKSVEKAGGIKCLKRIESAFKQLEKYVEDTQPSVVYKIEKDFNLCEPLNLTRDLQHFFYELSDTVAGLVQSHRDFDIQFACEVITNNKIEDDVEAFGKWIIKRKREDCIDMNYDKLVKTFTNATWGSKANEQLRQWIYQTCDAFGWFQSGTSLQQSFGSLYPQVNYFIQMCSDFYGNHFTKNVIEENVAKTNNEFGGLNPKISNVYSTHGDLDPWKAMGAQNDLSESSPTVLLESYAHCADLRSISSSDTEEMKESKIRVKNLIKNWLKL